MITVYEFEELIFGRASFKNYIFCKAIYPSVVEVISGIEPLRGKYFPDPSLSKNCFNADAKIQKFELLEFTLHLESFKMFKVSEGI